MTDLIHRHCVPCEGGVPTVDRTEAEAYLASLPGWELDEESKVIAKKVNGRTFMGVIDWINRIAELAESEQHHPDLHLTGYRHLTIQLTTHAIGGLSENDFVLAAKINEIFK